MLAHIAHQQNAVFLAQATQKLIHLTGSGKARFIDHVKTPLLGFLRLAACQMMLQGVRFNPCFLKLLRGAGCRGKAFHLVAVALRAMTNGGERCGLSRACYAFKRGDAVTAGQDLLNCCPLTVRQMRVFLFNLAARLKASQRGMLILSLAHGADVLAFKLLHFFGRESPRCRSRLVGRLDKAALLNLAAEFLAHLRERCFAQSTAQGITHDGAFVGYGIPLKVSFPRIPKSFLDGLLFLLFACPFAVLVPVLGFFDDALRLVAILRGHILMAALHFLMWDIELRVAGAVLRDLGGSRAGESGLLPMFLDLLPARAGSGEIFLAVAFDFRRSLGAQFNFVA